MSSNKKSESLQVVIPECGCCKRTIVKNSIKCNVCTKVFHPSCAVKTKRCCDEEIATLGDLCSGDASPMSDITNKNLSNIPTHQELLLKVISELEAKNSILIENNSLLKFKVTTLEAEIVVKNNIIDNLSKKKKLNTNINNKAGTSTPHGKPIVKEDKYTATDAHDRVNSSGISNIAKAVTAIPGRSNLQDGLIAANAEVQVPGVSDMEKSGSGMIWNGENSSIKKADKIESHSLNKDERSEWTDVSHKKKAKKRSRTLVVGSNSESSSVEGVGKFKAFHLSNLKPDTTTENLQKFLNEHFTSVKCEKLTSKFPDSYSSFKVLILSSEYDKALDGSNWPNKASVHRFFRPRPNTQQTS